MAGALQIEIWPEWEFSFALIGALYAQGIIRIVNETAKRMRR